MDVMATCYGKKSQATRLYDFCDRYMINTDHLTAFKGTEAQDLKKKCALSGNTLKSK